MPATQITDLLPIPAAAREPHAYQIFGLDDGEQDPAKIAHAVKSTIARIKAAKADTDPKLWSKAARLVQDARITLSDPDKKAQLDARFGIIAVTDPSSANPPASPDPAASDSAPAAADPLAAVLPTADPLAAVLPPSNPLAPVQGPPTPTPQPAVQPVPLPATAPIEQPQSAPDPDAASDAYAGSDAFAAPATVVVKQPKRRRRKRSVLGILMFMTFTLGMCGLVGVLGYFLIYSSGEVAITNTDGKITISTNPVDNPEPVISPPHDVNERSRGPVDPVMGGLASNGAPPITPQDPSGLQPGGVEPPGLFGTPGGNFAGNDDRESDSMDSGPAMADPDAEDEPAPPPDEPAMELTDEMIAKAEETLKQVRELIRTANWKQMKPAAEAATEQPMTDEQKATAEALFELADLASYYRGGIERSVADLEVGADFAVTDSFRVIVVERGDDLLVVRYNQKNQSFRFDEFPFSLAHRLATFSMPDSPTGQAAKAAFQAIAPKATDAYREEAVTWLREISGEVDGADPKRVADTIEELFGEDA